MEYLDVVDENDKLTGKTEERNIIHKEGIWHREVAVWIINDSGEILLQKRAATKKQYPNKWAICAGHVDAGEKVESAIIREINEELGIDVKIDDLEYIDVYKVQEDIAENNIKNYYFNYTYFLNNNYKIEDYTIQLEELSELKFISLKELENIVKTKNKDFTFSDRLYMEDVLEKLRKNIKKEN